MTAAAAMAAPPSTAALALDVVRQAVPNALASLGSVLVTFVTVIFVSRSSDDAAALGGVGMGSMLYNILGLSLGYGVTSALDTLVSQSNGAGRYRLSGVFLHRSIVVATATCAFGSLALCLTRPVLIWVGQDHEVAEAAWEYVRGALPSMWPMYVSNALTAYLRAQKIPGPAVVSTWAANAAHFLLCYLFISSLRWGALGAGIAYTCTQFLNLVVLASYIHFVRPGVTKESWVAWDWSEATRGLRSYMALALPCAALMWAEWWCCEAITLIAGYLGVRALAAHTAALQCFVLIYMTAGGISGAGASLVGNAVGSADPSLARRSAVMACVVMTAVALVINAFLVVGTGRISDAFSSDPVVQDDLSAILGILLVVVPLDSWQTVVDGILRGLGKQALAFRIKIVCMWAIRIPLAWYLGLRAGFGVSGVWWGSAAGLAVTLAAYLPVVLLVDWEAEASACGYHRLPGGAGAAGAAKFCSPAPGMCRRPTADFGAPADAEDCLAEEVWPMASGEARKTAKA